MPREITRGYLKETLRQAKKQSLELNKSKLDYCIGYGIGYAKAIQDLLEQVPPQHP